MDDELRTAVDALAVRLDTAAVHPGEGTHNGEADSKAAFGALERAFRLREEIEDVREHVRGDPDPVVAYADHDLATSSLAQSAIRPPGFVYFVAFVRRLTSACARRVLSASTNTGSLGSATSRRCARASIAARVVSSAS